MTNGSFKDIKLGLYLLEGQKFGMAKGLN